MLLVLRTSSKAFQATPHVTTIHLKVVTPTPQSMHLNVSTPYPSLLKLSSIDSTCQSQIMISFTIGFVQMYRLLLGVLF